MNRDIPAGVRKAPVIIAVSGLKNSGKTALIEAVIPPLSARGLKVAVLKHHGHGFEGEIPDKPGTDTWRFLANGAYGAVIYDADTFALVKRKAAGTDELISLFPEADLIFLEGSKREDFPRIAMLRGEQTLSSDPGTVFLCVTDPDVPEAALPSGAERLPFEERARAADIILRRFFG
ncbi:MAG: molybdopterin-guanine dinucleotide biosynthesis protein B [Clostridiales bacterium]|nr:molybdopterin-guanine dinucleotide biosynthesis protein B [Clostridiales bacterium]